MPPLNPEGVIRETCVDMVCVGEGEGAILDIATRAENKESFENLDNIWIKKDGEVIKPKTRPLIQDLDTLPFPDWSIYGDNAFYKPYMGYVYKYGDFEMSRGCPYKCSYWYQRRAARNL